ncbi:MAG: pyruvate:ferredoxin (flavodoxin) oxidoreductase [Lachnospiraceae bacterium]|nr:pyruvate:ferredoxin (flavodoxin) oxidoreductase [Lachnospiraceae bacterium]
MKREMKTMDGNHAAAYVAYAYSDVAVIYPITPSSPMAELTDQWAAKGEVNLAGKRVVVSEMQSEAGAAGAVHGALLTGARTTTFTASQGLLLMIPNLYKIAGEQLPGVFHVAARAVASHALSIFGDHSDVYACRQTGAVMLCSSSVQEVMDLAPAAHVGAMQAGLPFLHFFDGFRTSHEMQKIEVWNREQLASLWDEDAFERFRERALRPEMAKCMGSAQNPDVFFQYREAANPVYERVPEVVDTLFEKIEAMIGKRYELFEYYGDKNAEHVIIAMGSVCETICETVDAENQNGQHTGLVKVRLYRPFSREHLLRALPRSVKQITVLDRTKEPGSIGEPLFLDVAAALRDSEFESVPVFSGRYGLGSKDTDPAQIHAVFHNQNKKRFTIGIRDDVTHLSLDADHTFHLEEPGLTQCMFWGLGGDGTIGANKNSVKIIGDHTDKYAQAYFSYDSKKSRGLTVSYLRFGDTPIRSCYLIRHADFVACHNETYVHKYDMVQYLRDGGTFLLNTSRIGEELQEWLPVAVKRYLAEHHIRFYIIDGIRIGKEIGLNSKINTILQAAFFRVAGVMDPDQAKELMKEAAERSYGRKGRKIVETNQNAIDRGMEDVSEVEVPKEWSTLEVPACETKVLPDREVVERFVSQIQSKVTEQQGDVLPVSVFAERADGAVPSGTAAHDRRNVAVELPVWRPENCIQCNRCAYVCPHAVIRPAVMDADELAAAPEGMESIEMTGMPDLRVSMIISEVDCTGCGSCAGVCPGRGDERKALVMVPAHEKEEHQEYFDYGKTLSPKESVAEKFAAGTVKSSQYRRPLFEFSGACAGCGETPYAKLVTQLFGERMYIANATGCSSIWGNSYPSTPYTATKEGRGPAWANSLFEDAAEFGYGMYLGRQVRGEEASVWIFGGDGWAYDIGFGGLDHVLASGGNVNVLVFDTEVYSNTGGQASKATPMGVSALFASDGNHSRKKNLASMMMSYGHVYVAQIAMGADFNQTLKAITEAESYQGPSLIIAYSPCILHGIKAGMGSSQHEQKKAVDAGHFALFRYHPCDPATSRQKFTLDSREPSVDYEEFMEGEIRFTGLAKTHPEEAERLFAAAKEQTARRFRRLWAIERWFEQNQL